MLRVRGVVGTAFAAFALAAGVLAAPASPGRGETAGLATFEAAVVARINEVRSARGRTPLRANRRLAAAADFHSRDMGRRGYFRHASADGTPFWRRIRRFYRSGGFSSWSVGENLLWASNRFGAAFAVRQWMTSPSHRRNMLSRRWREVGVGAAYFASAPGEYERRAVTIVTADFGARS